MRALAEDFVSNLVEIHAVDYQAAGLGDLGRPAGYVWRQIEGWTLRYSNARTDDIPDIERVAAWLAEHMPPDANAGGALIHNDYKYDNLVLAPDDVSRIIGVLDWEMATIGDPLMDLGTSLGYWVDPDDPPELQMLRFGLTALPGNLNRRELAQRYASLSGRDVSNNLFYYVYALLKIAVIVQQIYARYKAGFTKDDRFAMMIEAVRVLGRTAVLAIEKKRIDDLTGA
jgi:aminoglycoside phosphotransferase (APT) family kinase protein